VLGGAAIRAEREAWITNEIERELKREVEIGTWCVDDGTKYVVCNNYGSDFNAYVGEFDHCPTRT
jgi:hypothetical protein